MKYRVLKGFVFAPGRIARPGEVVDLDPKSVGVQVGRGFLEPVREVPQPAPPVPPGTPESFTEQELRRVAPAKPTPPAPATPAAGGEREQEPGHRDPTVRNRDPRASHKRTREKGDQG
jgi:hypothetical protein